MLLLLDLLDDDEPLLALGGGVEVSDQPMASLGAYGPMPRKGKRLDDELNEALSADVVSRLSDEMMAASVTAHAVKQAKRRRNEAILLLMM